MKFDRTKNASRNIFFGLIQRIYQIIVPFIMRTAMIYLLGVEYLGLDSLFTSILSVLNLAELGVGTAMVYNMYRPIAEDDRPTICALMRLYMIYYRIIGGIILVGGLILCPFVPNLISGSIPSELNIYILFLLNLGATVLSYWLFAYKNCLLQAYQRSDIVSKITMFINTIKYLLQFLLLFIFHNYYYYLIVTLAMQAIQNIVTAFIASHMFPNLKASGKLPKKKIREINNKIKDLFTAKLGSVIVNSVDTLVISAFLGLTLLAIYQNYYYIITAVLGIVNIVIYSCTATIGNSIVVETNDKNFEDLKVLTFLIAGIGSGCASCMLCIFQPFMELWVGNDLMFEMPAVVCFTIYFFVVEINTLLNMYKDAAGLWHEDRFRPLITAIANLLMNLVMVQFLGIYGILLSTVLSMVLIGMPWLIHNLFTVLFDKNDLKEYVLKLINYTFSAFCVCLISYCISVFMPFRGIWLIIFNGIACCIVTIVWFIVFYHKSAEFIKAIFILDKVTKNKFKLSRLVKNKKG